MSTLQEMFIYQTPKGDFYSGSVLQPGEVEKVGTHHKCVLGIKCSDLSVISTVAPRKILASIGALILEHRTAQADLVEPVHTLKQFINVKDKK